jgi:hypothetical protein
MISKIKVRDGQITIVTTETDGGQNERETTIKSYDAPHEDFYKALDALQNHARDILQLPRDWREGQLRISGVSFSMSEDTGVMGAVMTGQVALDTSDAPFNFNTPHLPFDQYSPTGNAPTMPESAQRALKKVQAEAEAFINGKRAQGDLFASPALEAV